MSVPFYVPDVDDDEEVMLGGPTGVPVAGTPGQPLIPGHPQRWVAVSGLTGNVVDANIRQPDPDKLVLCACINKYGCICYGYHDELEVWSRRMVIMAVVFAILTSPVILLCFIPALSYMKQADEAVKKDMIVTARELCNKWRSCFSCGLVWIFSFLFVSIIVITTVGVTQGVAHQPTY